MKRDKVLEIVNERIDLLLQEEMARVQDRIGLLEERLDALLKALEQVPETRKWVEDLQPIPF